MDLKKCLGTSKSEDRTLKKTGVELKTSKVSLETPALEGPPKLAQKQHRIKIRPLTKRICGIGGCLISKYPSIPDV